MSRRIEVEQSIAIGKCQCDADRDTTDGLARDNTAMIRDTQELLVAIAFRWAGEILPLRQANLSCETIDLYNAATDDVSFTVSPRQFQIKMIEVPRDRYDVFLAHSSGDKATVRIINRRLRSDFGINAFYDEDKLPPGGNFVERILNAMQMSDCVAFFCGPSKPGSFFLTELGMAIAGERARGLPDGFVIPVLLPKFERAELHDLLQNRTWVDLQAVIDFDTAEEDPQRDALGGLADSIKRAVGRNAAGVRLATGNTRPSFGAEDLPKLCNRHEHADGLKDDLERFSTQTDFRPIVQIVRGPTKQKPRAFVDRVLFELVPKLEGFETYPQKVQHDIVVSAAQLRPGRRGELFRSLTNRLIDGCKAAGIDIKGEKSLGNVVRGLSETRLSVVIQVGLSQDQSTSPVECLRAICEYYSQDEFEMLKQPLVICVLVSTDAAPPGSFFTQMWQSMWGKTVPSDGVSTGLGEDYKRLSVLEPPDLDDVNEKDVDAWAEHPFVKTFNPAIANSNFEVVFSQWATEFGKREAPMADALEDLANFVAKLGRR